jgi:hypothetical protein
MSYLLRQLYSVSIHYTIITVNAFYLKCNSGRPVETFRPAPHLKRHAAVEGLCAADALACPIESVARRWLIEMEQATKELRERKVTMGGEKLKDGLILARRLDVKEAYRLYGKS